MAEKPFRQLDRELSRATKELHAATQAYEPYLATRPLAPGEAAKKLDTGHAAALARLQHAKANHVEKEREYQERLRAEHETHGPVDHFLSDEVIGGEPEHPCEEARREWKTAILQLDQAMQDYAPCLATDAEGLNKPVADGECAQIGQRYREAEAKESQLRLIYLKCLEGKRRGSRKAP